jgi:WD40 repeat protein
VNLKKKNKKKLADNISGVASEVGTHIAIAVIAGLIVYVFASSGYESEIAELNNRIEEMKSAERNALITKRISEQMEDIGYEQKALSDKQRERAEEQSRLADIERGKAELEREAAREAERKARASAKEAETMRAIAEQQSALATQNMEEAIHARSHADTLFYQSLARSLAQTSITQYKSGDKSLAALLAYSAWYYTDKFKGNVYHQDIYTALLDNAPRARMRIGRVSGNPRVMAKIPDSYIKDSKMGYVIATDYGEICNLIPKLNSKGIVDRYDEQIIFNDPNYLFRDVCIVNGYILALDVSGTLVKTTLTSTNNKRTSNDFVGKGPRPAQRIKEDAVISRKYLPMSNMPQERWHHLLQNDENKIIAVGEHQVVWLDANGNNILHTHSITDEISEAGVVDNTLVIFTKAGNLLTFNDGKPSVNTRISLPRNNPVSYYYYMKDKGMHILGTEDGDVLLYDKDHKHIKSLVGHSGAITHMEQLGWCLATSSYDHKICLWNLDDLNTQIAPIEVYYDKWPLSFTTNRDNWTLIVGLADGDIESLHISVEDNKDNVHEHIERNFTPQEWEYYIGEGVKYRRFKE